MQLYQQVLEVTNMVHQEDLVVAVVTIVDLDQEDQELQDKVIMVVMVNKMAEAEAEAVKALQVLQEEAQEELEVLVDSIQQLLLDHHQVTMVTMQQEDLAVITVHHETEVEEPLEQVVQLNLT